MGNKLGRRRQVVDENYTRPQGLYQHKDVDHKKLRKLILDSKLAPCYPGDEDCACDLEECPICFLYYPSLNRSRCCMKGICTECFLQMKAPNSTRPTQCPFCKTSNYAVEYRGVKTKEEKGMEQMEEQRVIEAKIRMQQQELQDEEERMQKRCDVSSSSRCVDLDEVGYCSIADEEIVPSQESIAASAIRQTLRPRQNREDEFDLDLEDIMVMEAIWLSIQENGRHRNRAYGDATPSEQYVAEDHAVLGSINHPLAESSSSPSGGLACAIAALAERQQTSEEYSSNYSTSIPAYNMHLAGCSRFSADRVEQVTENYPQAERCIEVMSPESQVAMNGDDGEWRAIDNCHGSEVAVLGTNYAGSEAAEQVSSRNMTHSTQGGIEDRFQAVAAGTIVPESFEEQMMLALAVSLAEARARTNAPGVAWQ